MAQALYRPTVYPWLGFDPSVTITPPAMSAIGSVAVPTVVLGSIVITPPAATAIGSVAAPTVLITWLVTPSPASARGTIGVPGVVLGSITIAMTASSARGIIAAPTVAIATPGVVHWFWDYRTGGWFRDVFASSTYNPLALDVLDGDKPSDRTVILGGEDGRIRKIDDSVTTDDGNNIVATVTMGPLFDPNNRARLILNEVQGALDSNGSSIQYEVLTGDTAEIAHANEDSTFAGDGTLDAARGLSRVHNPKVGGRALYIKVGTASSATGWAMEYIRTRSVAVTTDRGRRRDNDAISYP